MKEFQLIEATVGNILGKRGRMKCVYLPMRFLNERRVVIALILVAILLRCMGLSRTPWIDEISSISVASGSPFLESLRHYDHPPLYFVTLREWMLVSTKIEWLRALSILFSVGTIVAMYGWLSCFSSSAGLLGALIFGFLPAALSFSQEIRDYPLLMFAYSVSLLCAEKLLRNPKSARTWVCLSLSLTVCASTHVLGILATVTCVLYMFARNCARPILLSGRLGLSLLPPLGVWAFFTFCFLTEVSKREGAWFMPQPSVRLVTSVIFELLGIPSIVWPIAALRLSSPALALIIALVAFALFVLFVYHLTEGSLRAAVPALVATLGYLVPVLAYSLVVTPIFVSRTALPSIVPLCGGLACFIDSIESSRARRIVIGILMVFCLSSGVRFYQKEAFHPREPWSEISRIVAESRDPIFVSPSWSVDTVKYFVADESRTILALDTMSKEAVNALMSKSAGYLIMYTPAAMSAEAQAVREGVIASFFAAKTQTAIFSRGPVSVRRIQGPSGATSTISPSGLNPP